MKSKSKSAFFFAAITYVENGQLHEALACYLEADKLKPDNEKITFNLGNLVRFMIGLLLLLS